MIKLQQDLLESQRNITALLTEYEKISETLIKSNYTSQLHTLLHSIASFDSNRIKDCQQNFKDQTALKLIEVISDQIKNHQQIKYSPSTQNKSVEKPKPQEVKRESRIAEKKEEGKKGGLFQFVRNKFSKEKKATEMIFPEEEPKCYYDPVTKSYIWQGQQPEAPKVIPKPPSAASIKPKQEPKKPAKQESELGQLTAPPAFKRKSTPAANTKAKIKIKEEVEVVKEEQPLTFAKLMETINQQYNALLEKTKNGSYERHNQISLNYSENFAEIMTFTQRTLKASEEINCQEIKFIQKWGKILTSDCRELKIMEKVLKEIGESAHTYNSILSKLDAPTLREKNQSMNREELIEVKQVEKPAFQAIQKSTTGDQSNEIERQLIRQRQISRDQQSKLQKYQRKLEQASQKIAELNVKLNELTDIKRTLQNTVARNQKELQRSAITIKEKQCMINTLNEYHQESSKEVNSQSQYVRQLFQRNKNIMQELRSIRDREKTLKEDHFKEIEEIRNEYKNQIKSSIDKISELQSANYELHQEKIRIQSQHQQQRLKISNNLDKASNEMTKQRAKIESQLKWYEQKEKCYITSLQYLQQQESLVQQYDSSLCQQNKLLNAILEKRLQLCKNPQFEESISCINHQEDTSSTSIILELSDILNSITETYLDRLEAYNKYCYKMHKKYLQTKKILNKVKSNAANENVSLNRNVTRLKGLLQTYKSSKDETEERCSQLQLQCDKLKKKLQHYKQEDQFNKSYLSRLKTSKINNQNQSVLSLQEDNQELASEIQQLQKQIAQKEKALKKNQDDLEDLLINYEKNQSRLLDIQKRYKDCERQLRIAKQQLEQESNSKKLLQLKLQNLKDKCDEIQNREQSRLKNTQSVFDKKIKLLKNDLVQAAKRQEQFQAQIENVRRQFRIKITSIQQAHIAALNEANKKIKQREDEGNQMILLLDETNQKFLLEQEEKQNLLVKNKQLSQIEKQISAKINLMIDQHLKEVATYRQSIQDMNNVIITLNEKNRLFKIQQESFKSQYEGKIDELQQTLQISFEESKDLESQIQQYSQLLQQTKGQLERLILSQKNGSYKNSNVLKEATNQNQKLNEIVASLKTQLKQSKRQNSQFQQIIEKMSEDLARLTSNSQQLSKEKNDLEDKLLLKNRQIQTLSNEINKRSEELLIKTQELLEKDTAMLELEQQSVMKKEEFDQLKNQIQKLTQEIKVKDLQIQAMSVDLSELAEQLQQTGSNDDEHLNAIQALTIQIDELKKTVEKRDEDINRYSQNLSKLHIKLQEKEQEISRLAYDLANYNNDKQQLEDLKSAILEMNVSMEQIQQKYSVLHKENQNLLIISKQLENKLQEKQLQLSGYLEKLGQNDIALQKQQSEEIEGEMEQLLKEIDVKENQIVALTQQLTLKSFEFDQLLKKHNLMSFEFGEKIAQLEIKQRLHSEASVTLENINRQTSLHKKQIGDLTTKYQKALDDNKHLSEQNENLQSNLQQLLSINQSKDNNERLTVEKMQGIIKEKDSIISQAKRQYEKSVSQYQRRQSDMEKSLAQMVEVIEILENEIQTLKQTGQSRSAIKA